MEADQRTPCTPAGTFVRIGSAKNFWYSMFGLNKLADKDFVVGFVLPVLLGFCALIGLFWDFPSVNALASVLYKEKTFSGLTWLVLTIWALATLLLSFNRAVYRIFEGYYGPTVITSFFRRRSQKSYKQAYEEVAELFRVSNDASIATKERQDAQVNYARALGKLLVRFPYDSQLLLPTRLGNVIRAFETYANNVYKADGVSVWTRLTGVISSNYAPVINSARSEVDFFLNVCLLAIFVAALSFARLIYAFCILIFWQDQLTDVACYVVWTLGGLSVAFAAYSAAVTHAVVWGETVKGAFDLYLPTLAKQLGYGLPRVLEGPGGQQEFWDAVTAMIVAQKAMDPSAWPAVAVSASEDADGEKNADGEKEDKDDDHDGSDEPS